MTNHPLLLSTPMVLAYLAGRKTVTRRIPTCANSLVDGRRVSGKTWKAYDLDLTRYQVCELEDAVIGFAIWSNSKKTFILVEPIYQPGDKLWFRETWAQTTNVNALNDFPWRPHIPLETMDGVLHSAYIWKADGHFNWCDEDGVSTDKSYWRPSIHMPKSACRLWADCGTVTCEHLSDITEKQAKKEGLACITKDGGRTYKYGIPDRDGYPGTDDYGWHWQDWDINPVVAFKMLWGSIHGPDSWTANPPVYAINFNPTTRKP